MSRTKAVTGAPRFATVRAVGHVALAEIDHVSLAPLIAAHPEMVDIVAREILRIEAADLRLRSAAERNGTMPPEMEHAHPLGRLADRIRLFFSEKAPR
jgi:CRP-like cAMP-binding protein